MKPEVEFLQYFGDLLVFWPVRKDLLEIIT